MSKLPISETLHTSSAGVTRLCWGLLFLCVAVAYWPGLSGPFVFDDFATLEPLGSFGGINDWESFKSYVLGGTAGPTRRPLALISFVADAQTWPSDSWPFKRSNLIIHMINGILLGLLIGKILAILDFEQKDIRWIALSSAAAWLLHPFLVSTTLYVVQRMAQLSAMFVLAGLLFYVKGRLQVSTHPRRAYVIMSVAVCFFTLIGILAKENAILLPLLIGVLEWTIIGSRTQKLGVLSSRFVITFLVIPTMTVIAYLVYSAFTSDFFQVVPPREFSLYERLLTQPRILFDYLRHWFVPSLYTTGVFQDHFIASKSLLSPYSTLLSPIFHAILLTVAVVYRTRWPLWSFSILFFYTGHLLESTVLNLELYFEHRNYLPACFLFVPLIAVLQQRISGRRFAMAMIGVLIILAGFTHYSARIWKDFPSMVEASARKAPTSARAQADYAKDLFNAGRYEEALRVLDEAIKNIPLDKPHLLLSRLTMLCHLGMLGEVEFEQSAKRISKTAYDPRLISIYNEFVIAATMGRCSNVKLSDVRTMFMEMLDVKPNTDNWSERFAQIQYFAGFVDAHDNKPTRAVSAFAAALQASPSAHRALNMARVLATNSYFDEALTFAEAARAEVRKGQNHVRPAFRVTERQIGEFERLVEADRHAQTSIDSSGAANQ